MNRVNFDKTPNLIRRGRGFTLIELVVVLTILIATGSVIVPIIGNALTRSHVSTCATNFPEVSKIIVAANATLGDFGSGWSTGVFGTDSNAAVNDPDGTLGLTGLVDELTAGEATSLSEAGITSLCDHGNPDDVTDYNVTFNAGMTCVDTVAAIHVIKLNAAAATAVNLPTLADGSGSQYVWLGIDKDWSHLGTLTPEPPVHFGDTEGALPHQVYSRFGAIFEVKADGSKASFKRVTYNLEGAADAFETSDNHIGIHWAEVHGSGV